MQPYPDEGLCLFEEFDIAAVDPSLSALNLMHWNYQTISAGVLDAKRVFPRTMRAVPAI
jgi:hypothetical protein